MKPERIEFGLQSLPGWVREGEQGIRRVYHHADWREAMLLVELSQDFGSRYGRYPRAEICDGRVLLLLPPAGARKLLEADLELARALDSENDAATKEAEEEWR